MDDADVFSTNITAGEGFRAGIYRANESSLLEVNGPNVSFQIVYSFYSPFTDGTLGTVIFGRFWKRDER